MISASRKRDHKQREWARAYHSKERVEVVKVMGCAICGWDTTHSRPGQSHPIENAHITNGGCGRKADYDQVVNLCWVHHDEFDGGQGNRSARNTILTPWNVRLRSSGRGRTGSQSMPDLTHGARRSLLLAEIVWDVLLVGLRFDRVPHLHVHRGHRVRAPLRGDP